MRKRSAIRTIPGVPPVNMSVKNDQISICATFKTCSQVPAVVFEAFNNYVILNEQVKIASKDKTRTTHATDALQLYEEILNTCQ